MNCGDLDNLIDELADHVNEASHGKAKWRDAWPQVKSISEGFRGVKYPSREDRQKAWERFQSLVSDVKQGQDEARVAFEKRAANSLSHKNRILSYADAARPSHAATALFEVVTGAFIIRPMVDAVLGGHSDPWLETLQGCSRSLKAGWKYLSDWKGEIFRSDAGEAVQALRESQAILNEEWAKYKGQRQAEYEARQQGRRERESRRAEFRERVRARIENHESRIDRLNDVLSHKRSHLSDLHDKRSDARSDFFRERVDGWIREEEQAISDIEDKIARLREWIAQEHSRL
ncbi:MAG TPA: hypothetical protein VLC46_06445 [Thermoanaerobaculia bacterium]|jgi:hypothetical protein|nr:hypothetical protein [Thermoanaerobaculia bacterium]